MRKTLMTGLLLLAFSCPTLAGEMLTPPAPQPAPISVVQEPTTASEVITTNEDNTGAAATLAQIALDLVSSVLPLL